MYITPARVGTMGLGVDLSDIDAANLRSICARVSATIDSACNVPRLPKKHDFRGGTIVGERHDWIIDEDGRPHANRVYLNHGPVISVERLRIFATNTNYVEINVSEIVINQSSGYIEISSLLLTQYGVFGAGIIPYIGLYNPIVEVDYTYRWVFEIEDEEADFVDGKTYQLQNQFWLPSAPVTIKVDEAEQTLTTDYTLDKTEGRVIFVANQPSESIVTASYTHTLPWEISQAAGLLAADELGAIDVRKSGLTGLDSIRVVQGGGASVEKVRAGARRPSASKQMSELPVEIQRLLEGYVDFSVR